MRTFHCVTTCNKAGWELYGRRMVESFRDFWPRDIHISVYAEGFSVENYSERVHGKLLPLWLDDFKSRHAGNEAAKGMRGGKYDFRFDAVKFSHKVGAVTDAFFSCPNDVLIWIDADTVMHSPVSHGLLEKLLPDWAGIAWLDREFLYPECGFYLLDTRSTAIRKAMAEWIRLYDTDEVFRLQEWHDSYVLQQVIEGAGIRAASLSGDYRSHTHPFINGPLGAFADHMKGPRKQAGRSKPGDLRASRPEAYWNAK